MWDWYPRADPDFMLSVLTCGSWTVWNDSGYCSKHYDRLYGAQSAAINPAQRQKIVYQMQQMIATAASPTWCSTTPTRSRRTAPSGPT